MEREINLNEFTIPTDGGVTQLQNNSIKIDNARFDSAEVVFKDIEKRLIELINEYRDGAIFGCVAWLTSHPILLALENCSRVQILVQKEDFLRPDFKSNNSFRKQLQLDYSYLQCEIDRHQFREPMRSLSVCADPTVDAIRCIGNHNSDKNPAFPRSHHKFLVFCRISDKGNYFPISVWTGSFNFTKNATHSFENAIILTGNKGNNKIVNAYLNEHHNLYGLSEPLNWESEWCEPEYRIGT